MTFLVLAEKSPKPGLLLKADGSPRSVANLQAACQVDRLHPAMHHFLETGLVLEKDGTYAVADWEKRTTNQEREKGKGETTEGVGTEGVSEHPQSKGLMPLDKTPEETKGELVQRFLGGAAAPPPAAAKKKASKKEVDPEQAAEHMALVEALGIAFNANSQPEWNRCVAAAVILRKSRPPSSAAEVPLLKAAWQNVFPGATCTATGIANHVGALRHAEGPGRPRGNGTRRESPREQSERLMKELNGGD
jgi:hypothetical protein